MHHPHRGSMQFWPRKRAARALARLRNWTKGKEPKLQGFIGYKAGMTHLWIKEVDPLSPVKATRDVAYAATIIECPPLKPLSIRFYKKTNVGLKLVREIFAEKVEKEVKKKTTVGKNKDAPGLFDEVRLVMYTQPKLSGIGKKTPDVLEIGIAGKDPKQKLEFAQGMIDKEVRINDIFREGQLIDIHGVTKGKGFQGTVKRYGVKRRHHKSEKTIRGVGNLGSWTPKRVEYTVAQPGKMGYHQRTEYNKQCLILGDKPEGINQAGGMVGFGTVKNDYIVLKGSVAGVRKRAVVLTDPMRQPLKFKETKPEITFISKASKQRS